MSLGFAELSGAPRRMLTTGAVLCAGLAAIPLLALLVLGTSGGAGNWQRLFTSLLPTYLADTLVLLTATGVLSALIGTSLGWLLTAYDFPGRSTLQWLVLLPLAVPGYVVAYVYVGLMSYAGPMQTGLRKAFNWTKPEDYVFPEIRSALGAAIILAFVLYPYVYLAARNAFLKQSQSQVHAARMLGKTATGAFVKVAIPIAMPSIAVGILFVLLETLNDIGAAQFFGVQTVTYGVYALWLGEGNLAAATQLALLLCLLAMVFVASEQYAHRFEQKYRPTSRVPPRVPAQIVGWRAALAIFVAATPIIVGFAIPMAKLLSDSLHRTEQFSDPGLWLALAHTAELAVIVSSATILLGLVLVYTQRYSKSKAQRLLIWLGTFGYAIPGTVLAIGLLVPFGAFDRWVNSFAGTGLLLSGSLTGLAIALLIRFLTLSFRTLETGAKRVTPNLDAAARTLGKSAFGSFTSVHLPLLRPAIFAAAIMVFVDTMKELPATLLMRPFDFDTLATRLFEYASLSQLEDASAPALIIALAGLIPVYVLSRQVTVPDRD